MMFSLVRLSDTFSSGGQFFSQNTMTLEEDR
jgi:hypothetical protein